MAGAYRTELSTQHGAASNCCRPQDQGDVRENGILRRYHLSDREDYRKYNKICGSIRALAARLKKLPNDSPFRAKQTDALLTKLYNMGCCDLRSTVLGC